MNLLFGIYRVIWMICKLWIKCYEYKSNPIIFLKIDYILNNIHQINRLNVHIKNCSLINFFGGKKKRNKKARQKGKQIFISITSFHFSAWRMNFYVKNHLKNKKKQFYKNLLELILRGKRIGNHLFSNRKFCYLSWMYIIYHNFNHLFY